MKALIKFFKYYIAIYHYLFWGRLFEILKIRSLCEKCMKKSVLYCYKSLDVFKEVSEQDPTIIHPLKYYEASKKFHDIMHDSGLEQYMETEGNQNGETTSTL